MRQERHQSRINKASKVKSFIIDMRKKILLIDDKASIAKVVSIYLGKDYDFTYHENPIKAIEWLNEGNVPDLIISDIRMPEMMGDEFLDVYKRQVLKSCSKFIVQTSLLI